MVHLQIHNIDRHRNGISGAPFYVVSFDDKTNNEGEQRMVALVFDEPGYCAVLNVDKLAAGRGDRYEHILRREIKSWERTMGRR